jgi:hypothetical protein
VIQLYSWRRQAYKQSIVWVGKVYESRWERPMRVAGKGLWESLGKAYESRWERYMRVAGKGIWESLGKVYESRWERPMRVAGKGIWESLGKAYESRWERPMRGNLGCQRQKDIYWIWSSSFALPHVLQRTFLTNYCSFWRSCKLYFTLRVRDILHR